MALDDFRDIERGERKEPWRECPGGETESVFEFRTDDVLQARLMALCEAEVQLDSARRRLTL